MIVLFWSRATRDLLKSFGWGIEALHRLDAATKLPFPRRPPHSICRLKNSAHGSAASRPGAFQVCVRLGSRSTGISPPLAGEADLLKPPPIAPSGLIRPVGVVH